MNTLISKNLKALSLNNENLALKLLACIKNPKYQNGGGQFKQSENELLQIQNTILQTSLDYPFICLYGIANGKLIKNLSTFYTHILVFESEIKFLLQTLSELDLSQELLSSKLHIIYTQDEYASLQIKILFDSQNIFEWLSLYKLFISASFYQEHFSQEIQACDAFCFENAQIVLADRGVNSHIPFTCYKQSLLNIPDMLLHIPFQKLLAQRKDKFETAIVISAGPSLQKQLKLLKEVQEKAFLFCVDGALSSLQRAGIKPDYVLNCDFADLALKFFEKSASLEQSLFCFSIASHPKLIKAHQKRNLCISLRAFDNLKKFALDDFGYVDTGTCVSHFAYNLALELGFKNIIMLGQDLAFDLKGHSHNSDFAFGANFKNEEKFEKLQVKAYANKGLVLTHQVWNAYRIKLEFFFAQNAHKAHFYNATEGGASIAFTQELCFKDCIKAFLKQEKPKFQIPAKLSENEAKKLLDNFKLSIQEQKLVYENYKYNANLLHQALEQILQSNKDLPLEFLLKVKKQIQAFNTSINENELIYNDNVNRDLFFQRGCFLAEVLKVQFQEEKLFLLHFINAYKQWLQIFIKQSLQRLECFEKVLT